MRRASGLRGPRQPEDRTERGQAEGGPRIRAVKELEGVRTPTAESQGLDPGKAFRAKIGLPLVPALDGFRAWAVCGVVIAHLLLNLVPLGAAGLLLLHGPLTATVDLLFVLSGFVLFLPTAARGGRFGDVGQYALRRTARLFPALWLALLVATLLILVWPIAPAPPSPSLGALLIHAVGLHTPVQLVDRGFPLGLGIDGPLWTLSSEVIFYSLLPFVAAAFFRRPGRGLLIAAAVTIVWRIGAANVNQLADLLGYSTDPFTLVRVNAAAMNQFPAFAINFALGMAAAMALIRLQAGYPRRWLERRAVPIQAAALVCLIIFSCLFGSYGLDGNPLAAAPARGNLLLAILLPVAIATLMLATCLGPRWAQTPFTLPPVRALADISYGVYLSHVPAILFIGALLVGSSDLTSASVATRALIVVLAVAASVLYGYLSNRLLEDPVRRWAHRYRGREPVPAMSGQATSDASSRP
jgi:peptidoglycan/LPS O-acetylase OafA/YrhL